MAPRPLGTSFIVNMIGALARLLVALVTIPIYVHRIGDERYGVVSLTWVLIGYFGFFDLGLSRASANAMAKLRYAPQTERARVLVTTLFINLGLGLIGSLCLSVFGGYMLDHFIVVADGLKNEISKAFPWIVALVPLMLVSGVGIGALESRERFVVANLLQAAGMFLSQIIPVILATTISPSLALIIPAATMTQAIGMIAILVTVYRYEGPLHVYAFDPSQIRKLVSYGGWISVSNVIAPILVSLDQLLIGSVLGVAAVTRYVVPMNLVLRSQIFASALVRTLFPRMSALPLTEARDLASRAFTSLAYGYGAICAPAVILAPVFFRYWIGADFASVAAPVAEILFVGAWINGLALVPYTLLQSQGRPDVTGQFHLAQVLPYVVVLWWLTSTFGIRGAAAAWSLRCAADAVCLFWAAGLPISRLSLGLPPLCLLVIAALTSRVVGQNLRDALIVAAVMGLVSAAAAWIVAKDLRDTANTALAWVARSSTVRS